MSQARVSMQEDANLIFECPISGNFMEKPTMTSCGHTFEEESIKGWINRSSKIDAKGNCINTCPCCPEQISIPDLRRNYQLQAVLPYIKKQQMENKLLKNKLSSAELLKVGEDKSDRKTTALERDLNNATKTVCAINNLQEKQKQLIEQRKTLRKTSMPIIKEAYKKLAYVSQRLNLLENKSSDVNMMDLSDLEEDLNKQCAKYKTFHKMHADKMRSEIIEPYLKKLEEFNNQIAKNENDLRDLKAMQLKAFEKAATHARAMSVVSLSIFGGTSKLKQLQEIKKPVEMKKPEVKPALSIIERAKQTENLMNAVTMSNTSQALIALQKGANPNFTTENGTPFIICATKNENLDLVAVLLQYKCNVNATDCDRNTALHWAAYKNQVPLVLTLLENGVDPRIVNTANLTAVGETKNLLIKDTIAQAIQEFEAKERMIFRKA